MKNITRCHIPNVQHIWHLKPDLLPLGKVFAVQQLRWYHFSQLSYWIQLICCFPFLPFGGSVRRHLAQFPSIEALGCESLEEQPFLWRFLGTPITVVSVPFGRPRLRILAGILIDASWSCKAAKASASLTSSRVSDTSADWPCNPAKASAVPPPPCGRPHTVDIKYTPLSWNG